MAVGNTQEPDHISIQAEDVSVDTSRTRKKAKWQESGEYCMSITKKKALCHRTLYPLVQFLISIPKSLVLLLKELVILRSISANDGTSFWEQGEGVTGVKLFCFFII